MYACVHNIHVWYDVLIVKFTSFVDNTAAKQGLCVITSMIGVARYVW